MKRPYYDNFYNKLIENIGGMNIYGIFPYSDYISSIPNNRNIWNVNAKEVVSIVNINSIFSPTLDRFRIEINRIHWEYINFRKGVYKNRSFGTRKIKKLLKVCKICLIFFPKVIYELVEDLKKRREN